jgi:hypothetical protein
MMIREILRGLATPSPYKNISAGLYAPVLKLTLVVMLMLLLITSAVQAQDEPGVISFTANAAGYTAGDWLTVSWEVAGVDLALLEVYDLSAGDFPIQLMQLPIQGSRRVFVPTTAVNGIRLTLWAADRPRGYSPVSMFAHLASVSLDLPLQPPCRPTFYYSIEDYDACPVMTQKTTQAAFQPFENGFLLWRSDTGDVWAVAKSGTVTPYPASEYGALPDNPIPDAPPSGYTTPINGFGKVWGNLTVVRDALGWALGPEVGYEMTIQTEAVPARVSYFYMTMPDGQVMRVENGYWVLEPAE